MHLLVDHEVELVCDERHFALVVLDVIVFHLLEELLHARLAEELDKRLVFWISLECSEKEDASVLLVAFSDKLLGVVEELVDKGLLA